MSTATITPLLLKAEQAAALCGVSLRTWRLWHTAGKCPAPRKWRRLQRWSRDELRQWIAVGCPDRRTWQAMRDAGRVQ